MATIEGIGRYLVLGKCPQCNNEDIVPIATTWNDAHTIPLKDHYVCDCGCRFEREIEDEEIITNA